MSPIIPGGIFQAQVERAPTAAERAKFATGCIETPEGKDWGYYDEAGYWTGGFEAYDEAFAHALMVYKD